MDAYWGRAYMVAEFNAITFTSADIDGSVSVKWCNRDGGVLSYARKAQTVYGLFLEAINGKDPIVIIIPTSKLGGKLTMLRGVARFSYKNIGFFTYRILSKKKKKREIKCDASF